jgi:hypothetical protein
MLRGEETYWICQSRDCGLTAVCDAAELEMETHTCRCGSLMRKKFPADVFSYLNFLKEDSSEMDEAKEKEETPCEK